MDSADEARMGKIFKCVIAAQLILIPLGMAASVASESYLPEALREYIAAQDEKMFGETGSALSWLALGVSIIIYFLVTFVLLYRMRRIGMWLYLAGFALWPAYFFMGVQIEHPMVALLNDAVNVLSGATLALFLHPGLRGRLV